MTAAIVPASLQHVEKALEVGIDISMRMFDRVAHAGLGREMNDRRKALPRKERCNCLAIREIGLHKGEAAILTQDIQPRPLQGGVIIAVEIVEPEDRPAFGQKLSGDMKADETGRTRDQNWLIRHPVPNASFVVIRTTVSLPAASRRSQ